MKKKSYTKRLIAIALSIVMLLGIMPMSTFAATLDGTPIPLADGSGYELKLSGGNSIRFYNVLGAEESIAAMDKSEYIRRCLETAIPQATGEGISLPAGNTPANLWLYLGIEAQDQNGQGTDTAKFKTQFDNVLSKYISNYTLGTTQSISDGDNTYNVSSSGLMHATSMSNAGNAIKDKLYSYYQGATGTRDKGDAVVFNAHFNDNTTQDVYWTLISANKTSGTYKKGHYQAVAIVFSDFTLSPIFTADAGNTYTVQYLDASGNVIAEENAKTTKPLASGAVTNGSSEAAELTKTVSYSSIISSTSEVSGVEEYSFGQSIGAGVEFGDIFEVEISLDYGQAIADGWSNSESTESSFTQELSITTTVPAYTVAMINSKEESITTRVTYECPLALGYKVSIVEYTLDPTSNSADAESRVLATYGTDSRTTLYKSVMQGDGSDRMNWDADATAKEIAKLLATTMPYSASGASVTSTSTVTSFDVLDYSPYYPLSAVKALNTHSDSADGRLPVGIGRRLCVDNITLEGYNAQGGFYYGFRQDAGEWVLLDSSGAEIGQGTDNTPAKLYTDVDGKLYLTGQSTGELYLKYKIKENVYSSYTNPTEYATNEGITTAIIPVKIVDSVSICTPTYKEQTGDHTIKSTKEDLMKELHTSEVLKAFGDDCSDGIGLIEYLVYLTEEDAKNRFVSGPLTQEQIDDETYGKTFYVRSILNNHFSEYVKIEIVDKQKADNVFVFGEKDYDTESSGSNNIVIEDSVMDPASPTEAPNCNGPHSSGTVTCTEQAICADCGQSYGEPSGHKPNTDDGDCTTAITCSVCGDVTTPGAASHTGGSATCEDKAVCTTCGKPYGKLASHKDDNDDEICDVCRKDLSVVTENPQTGDNSNLWLWFALLFVSGTDIFAITVYDRKRKAAIKR